MSNDKEESLKDLMEAQSKAYDEWAALEWTDFYGEEVEAAEQYTIEEIQGRVLARLDDEDIQDAVELYKSSKPAQCMEDGDGTIRRCVLEAGHAVRHTHVINFAKPQNFSKEWARPFLVEWNRTVKLWEGGKLFAPKEWHEDPYLSSKDVDQRRYAEICCTWLIPNGFVEPHVVAQGG